jgi:hypothetical protein
MCSPFFLKVPGMLTASAKVMVLLAVFTLLLTASGQGQQPVVVNYQGWATDDVGDPLDTTVAMTFTIYNGSGVAQWSEAHPSVTVTEGGFSVLLGSTNTLADNVFSKEERYLGIQIGADPELTPRTRLASAPSAALAHRVDGDILTSPGMLYVGDENDAQVVLGQSAPLQAGMSIMIGDQESPVVDFLAHASGGSISLGDPDPSPGFASIELNTDISGASVALADPRPSPSLPDLLLLSNQEGSRLVFGEMGYLRAVTDERLSISADESNSNITLTCNSPDPHSLSLNTDCNGSNIAFGIIGDVPVKPGIDIGVNDTSANIDLNCTSTEEPSLSLNADCNGSNIAFGITGDVPMRPGIDIGVDDTRASIDLNCTSTEEPSLSLNTDCNGSNIAFGFIGDVPVRPGIDIGVGELEANMNFHFGKDPSEYPYLQIAADTQDVCMSIGWGSSLYNNPAWSLCVEPYSWRASWNIADLFIIRSGPEANEFVVNDTDGVTRVTLTEESLSMDDVSTNAKTVLQWGGLSTYTEDGELAAVFEPNGVVAPQGNFGSGNSNDGTYAFVAGLNSDATGDYSNVGGGSGNMASGLNATVPGGATNTASGDYSFAAGQRARAVHDGAFVWADANAPVLSSDIANQFKLRATGGTVILSDTGITSGVRLSKGSSVWQSLSDRSSKRNIRRVDGEKILEKLEQMPISRWSYKTQDESIEHIGPMAQDFYDLFEVGEDDKHISSLDPSGVALAAIQELHKENKELRQLVGRLEKRLAQLEERE